MGRDYAARNRRPAARAAGRPGWVWLVAGLSMGLVVACIVYIGRPAQPMPMAPAGGAGGIASANKAREKVEIPPVEEPRFDFYTLLEKEQMVVPGESRPRPPTKTPARPIAPTSAATTATPAAITPAPGMPSTPAASAGGTRYLILAGSFRDAANAEAHRAKLALAGVEARIESVRTQDGDTLQRVRIGPTASEDQAQSVAARLKSQGFESRVVKMP